MGKYNSNTGQFSLNFSRAISSRMSGVNSRSSMNVRSNNVVVGFVDKQTQSARDDAIRRVKANGIFRSDDD